VPKWQHPRATGSSRSTHMLMIVRMKPRDAVHEVVALGFGQRLLFFGVSEANRQVASSRSDHGMISRADTLLQLPRSASCLPLRSSVSRAAPGQSRRHAVRSSLDHLSRGPAHRERKRQPSGILILWLRCKNERLSRQYYEGLREGFPSVPKVGRPLDTGNLPACSFRLSQ
jgi:hypothetical protein